MRYLQFTQYIYLIFAAFFIFEGFRRMNTGEDFWISFGIAAVSIFMFFFRRNFFKKAKDQNNNS